VSSREIGVENAVLKDVPVFARFRQSGKEVAGKGKQYRIADFNYGLIVPGLGMTGTIGMIYKATPLDTMPESLPSAIRPLPPTEEWVNVRTLGVAGDGTTDDTAAIQMPTLQCNTQHHGTAATHKIARRLPKTIGRL
jgi:hypothetical protein